MIYAKNKPLLIMGSSLILGMVGKAGISQAAESVASEEELQTVVVTGVVTEGQGRHAWNKSNVNGQWKAVDVTWNDGSPPRNEYLLINDSQFTGHAARTESDYWMNDARLGDYATP
jgi:hypothetical protein